MPENPEFYVDPIPVDPGGVPGHDPNRIWFSDLPRSDAAMSSYTYETLSSWLNLGGSEVPVSPDPPPLLDMATLPASWRVTQAVEDVRIVGSNNDLYLVTPVNAEASTLQEHTQTMLDFALWFSEQPEGLWAVSRRAEQRTNSNGYRMSVSMVLGITNRRPTYGLRSAIRVPDYTYCSCGYEQAAGASECPACLATLVCNRCNISGYPLLYERGDMGGCCLACTGPCQGCAQPTAIGWAHCTACATWRGYCGGCDNPTTSADPGASFHEEDGYWYCGGCTPEECPECGRRSFGLEYSSAYDADVCGDCFEREYRSAPNSPDAIETFDDDAELSDTQLRIPALPNRAVRLCGLEIEGGGNYGTLVRRLFAAGLVDSSYIAGYHNATRQGNSSSLWSLEEDGSVDWELVSPIIDLDKPAHLRQLRDVLKVVRADIKEGNTYLDLRCGLHVHVSAERFTPTNAFNLSMLFGYIEDTMFRLGAAKWAHHRALNSGPEYCRPINKEVKNTRQFGVDQERTMDRYGALSFRNYFNAMLNNCGCGATRYDSWDTCECELSKCTFEFRLFNSSVNSRKIHAYLALCQALVAKATTLGNVDDRDLMFPADSYINSTLAQLNETRAAERIDAWTERLTWMLTELPLTESEKDDILYCVRNSELAAIGEDAINGLVETPNTIEEVLA